jgi:hypothetical protein
MTSINGVELKLLTQPSIQSEHTQLRTQLPGADGCSIDDLGYNGDQIRIRGYETALDRYDAVIAEFMASGAQELVLRDDWKYYVYSNRKNLAPNKDDEEYFTYEFLLFTTDPYQYSEDSKTFTKAITTDGQEWSADDSSVSITTSGTVAAKPDIQVTAGAGSGYGGIGAEDEQYVADENDILSLSYILLETLTHTAVEGKAWQITEVKADAHPLFSQSTVLKWTAQATSYNSNVETEIAEEAIAYNADYTTLTADVSGDSVIAGHNEDFVVRLYGKNSGTPGGAHKQKNFYSTAQELLLVVLDDVQVYNTADTTVKCDVTGLIHPETIVRINANNSGTYQYSDDFSTDKFYYHTYNYLNAAHDAANDECDISASGYIEYVFDLKYPVLGIPTLTAQIDIDAGTPVIQIAEDDSGVASTYYDIDTTIVDNVSTVYSLDNDSSLHLKGKTKFWLKVYCDASASCSVVSMQLDVNLDTSGAENPLINTGAANTFRCDQNSGSSFACSVDLIFEDRKWSS